MEPLKSLYNDWEVTTDEGNALYREIYAAIEPVMKRMAEAGYRIREVAQLTHSAVSEQEAYLCLSRNMDAHRRGERPKKLPSLAETPK
jgi:hypothetical protein